ncbi:hypothetical protein DK880_00802 [Candidatus Cardinium hertigii]|uniref:Transposase InsH N-terminal domain-containing protein n=1 Tax=Candidatus Cardinium hertigii TaxID=247481 RepID=A0A2Z3L993_9BACT|nr:hypothetical protein DK880_00802 [Candidatus Cardinium hertigii]
MNKLIDWSSVEETLHLYDPTGLRLSGKPAYSPLLLFTMLLLQTGYGLRDYPVEEAVNDRITFSRFCGIAMDSSVPDHRVVSRFRTTLITPTPRRPKSKKVYNLHKDGTVNISESYQKGVASWTKKTYALLWL